MNTIGIIVAMGKELDLLLHMFDNFSTININNIEFYSGKIGHVHAVAMQCGIGKVNAAVGALTMIENFHVSIIINTGVAGGTGNNAGVLDIVIAENVAYHDVWCGPGTVAGQASGFPLMLPCVTPREVETDAGRIKKGLIASGDIFVSKCEDINRILSLYPEAMAVDMESAAIAQVCFMKSVPFMAIRVISDTPGHADNISQYENFWEDAPQSTFKVLKDIILKEYGENTKF